MQEFQEEDMYPPIPETNVELHASMIEVESRKIFSHINKDVILANLDIRERYAIMRMTKILGFATYYGLTDLKQYVLHDLEMLLAVSRAKNGWQQESLGTSILKTRKEKVLETKKQWGMENRR